MKLRFLPCWAALLMIVFCGGVQAGGQQATVDSSAPLREARLMLAGGDYAGADRALRAILAAMPDMPDAHFSLGFALLHEQKAAESLTEYLQGAKLREPGAEEMTGIALDYIQLGDLPNAEHWLAAAAKRAPERPLVWYLLGRTQYNEGHGEDAERSLLACLRLDPHHLRAEYNLGLVDELLKRPEAAAVAYRTAITWQEASEVKYPEPYLHLGALLRRQDKAAEALPLLAVAAGGGSRDAAAHQELGLAYEQLGRYNEAAGELKAAIALDPQNKALHFFLGRVDRKGGQRDEAAREFALAATFSPR